MEEIVLTANQLHSLLMSSAKLGFAAGQKERTLENAAYKADIVVEGLKKTNNLNLRK